MNRRKLLLAAALAPAATFVPTASASHYRRIPYTPQAYAEALQGSEPVLVTFYASW